MANHWRSRKLVELVGQAGLVGQVGIVGPVGRVGPVGLLWLAGLAGLSATLVQLQGCGHLCKCNLKAHNMNVGLELRSAMRATTYPGWPYLVMA